LSYIGNPEQSEPLYINTSPDPQLEIVQVQLLALQLSHDIVTEGAEKNEKKDLNILAKKLDAPVETSLKLRANTEVIVINNIMVNNIFLFINIAPPVSDYQLSM